MKLLFVVNPISGGVDKEPFLKEARAFCEKYGIDYHIFKTTGKNDEEELAKVIDSYGPDRVASCGGDGTTLFTAVNLLGRNIPMGIIPLGSANGMAAELKVPAKPVDALKDMVMSEVIEGLDLVLVNDQYYTLHIGDVGLNAQIVAGHAQSKSRGMAAYAKHFFSLVKDAPRFNATLILDGQEVQTSGLMYAFCNARKYGTGVPITFDGNPMDGKFELVVLEKVDVSSLVKAGLSAFDMKYFDHQVSTVYTISEAEVIFEEPQLLQLDGEVIGEFKHIKAKVIPQAVPLITHKDNEFVK